MAVKDWHPGQVVMVVVVCGLVFYVGWWLGMEARVPASPTPGQESLGVGGSLLLMLGGCVGAFVVLWKWFDGRKKPPGSDS